MQLLCDRLVAASAVAQTMILAWLVWRLCRHLAILESAIAIHSSPAPEEREPESKLTFEETMVKALPQHHNFVTIKSEPVIVAAKPKPLPRYLCKCKAKLPKTPTHSRIDGDATVLVFKCGRCGRETEVDMDSDHGPGPV